MVAWIVADAIAKSCGRHPLVNPVLIAIVLMGSILVATGTPYETYFQGAQFVHFLLGPANVAIAVPLVRHRALVRANILPMLAALSTGAVTAVVSVVAVATALGVPREILMSMAAGIAMAIRPASHAKKLELDTKSPQRFSGKNQMYPVSKRRF